MQEEKSDSHHPSTLSVTAMRRLCIKDMRHAKKSKKECIVHTQSAKKKLGPPRNRSLDHTERSESGDQLHYPAESYKLFQSAGIHQRHYDALAAVPVATASYYCVPIVTNLRIVTNVVV